MIGSSGKPQAERTAMAIDCLLINPRHQGLEKYPPISLIYLATFARKNGYEVDICEARALLLEDEDVLEVVRKKAPRSIGFTFMTAQFPYVKRLSEAIRKAFPDIIQFAGGTHVNSVPELSLQQLGSLDFLVLGEGEMTFVELLGRLKTGTRLNLEEVKGVAFRQGDGMRRTEPRELIKNLDDLPMPMWELLPIDRYNVFLPSSRYESAKGIALTISGSRGCPYNCIFCASHCVFPRGWRNRSPLLVANELEYLYRKFGVRHYFFVDEVLFYKPDTIRVLAQEIIKRELPLIWAGNARVDSPALTDDVLELVKQAGCVRIDFGVESGSARVLKEIRKGITLEDIYKAHKMVQSHGIATTTMMIVGHPSETREDLVDSLYLVANLRTTYSEFGAATPFPGTDLYALAKKNGWLRSEDWSNYYVSNTYQVMRTEHFSYDDIPRITNLMHSAAQIFVGLERIQRQFPRRIKSFLGRVHCLWKIFTLPHTVNLGVKTTAAFIDSYFLSGSDGKRAKELLSRLLIAEPKAAGVQTLGEICVMLPCASAFVGKLVLSLAARTRSAITIFCPQKVYGDIVAMELTKEPTVAYSSVKGSLIKAAVAWQMGSAGSPKRSIYFFDASSRRRTWKMLLAEAFRLAIVGVLPGFYVSYYGDVEKKPLRFLSFKLFERIIPAVRGLNPAIAIESVAKAVKPWTI
jgi:anaerobic magnesium-protoporphyrin IX monomethyl ester cyclase